MALKEAMENEFYRIEDLNVEIDELQRQRDELDQQVKQLLARNGDLGSELQQAQAELEQLRSQLATLQQALEQSYSPEDYQRLAERIYQLEVERDQLRQQVQELQLREPLPEESAQGEELPIIKALEELAPQLPIEVEVEKAHTPGLLTATPQVESVEPAITAEEVPPVLAMEALAQEKLAKRLNVAPSNVYRNRLKGDAHFTGWSKEHDPEGRGWRFDAELKRYVRVGG